MYTNTVRAGGVFVSKLLNLLVRGTVVRKKNLKFQLLKDISALQVNKLNRSLVAVAVQFPKSVVKAETPNQVHTYRAKSFVCCFSAYLMKPEGKATH